MSDRIDPSRKSNLSNWGTNPSSNFNLKNGAEPAPPRKTANEDKLSGLSLKYILPKRDGFDPEKTEALILQLESLGEKLFLNDLVLINEIAKNPALKKRLFNKNKLVEGLSDVYKKPAFYNEYYVNLQNGYKKHGTEYKAYSERPNLDKLSNLQLLRLNLLREALLKPQILAALGKIVFQDINDKSTEYGGIISIKNGEIAFEQIDSSLKSSPYFDGLKSAPYFNLKSDHSYSNGKDHFFSGGLADFHLHATTEDFSKAASPSGNHKWMTGDFSYVFCYKQTDVLITSMGHPKDENGRKITNKLFINVDMYYIDERNPARPKAIIVDLGQYIVPYGEN